VHRAEDGVSAALDGQCDWQRAQGLARPIRLVVGVHRAQVFEDVESEPEALLEQVAALARELAAAPAVTLAA
jgi:hypothetical protein